MFCLLATRPTTVTVAAIQCSSDLGDAAANRKKLTDLVEEAARNGANWSVDHKQTWRGYGFSEIIDPAGKIIAAARSSYGSEIIYAEILTARN